MPKLHLTAPSPNNRAARKRRERAKSGQTAGSEAPARGQPLYLPNSRRNKRRAKW